MKECNNCSGNQIFDDDTNFCPNCGGNLSYIKSDSNDTNKVKEPQLVQAIKSDFQSSQSVTMLKEKINNTTKKIKSADAAKKKKLKILAIVCAVIIVLLAVVTNIHKCEECDKVYFGKKHTVKFFNQSEDVCKDCYSDFHTFSW